MIEWNRIAIEHWISARLDELDLTKSKFDFLFPVLLGVSVTKGYIPLDRAMASGLKIYVPPCEDVVIDSNGDILYDHEHRIIYEFRDEYIEINEWFSRVQSMIERYNKCKGTEDEKLIAMYPDTFGYPYSFDVVIDDRVIWRTDTEDVVFPSTGIYIYYHPYEGYKIGQAENIPRRMEKHWCSAPSAKLLHVIETTDLDWCERFIHKRFDQQRTHRNHEYFWLNGIHLAWLFGIDELNPPKSIGDQLSLLELL